MDDLHEEVPDAVVEVGPVVVVSPASRDGVRTYVQDPRSGLGLEVRLGGRLTRWPRAVGTRLQLRLLVQGTPDAPIGWLTSDADVQQLVGDAEPVVVALDEATLPWSLVEVDDVEVLEAPDVLGRARLSVARALDGRMVALDVGAGARGALTALVTEDGALAPRAAEDWVERVAGRPTLETTVAAIRDGTVPVGSAVRVRAVQATPWSPDGRWAVAQEPGEPVGLWVDAEGVLDGDGEPGQLRRWDGILAEDASGLRLRLQRLDPAEEARAVVHAVELRDGARVTWTVAGLEAPASDGTRRTALGWLLDPRFVPLDALPDPVRVEAVVRGDGGSLRLVVLGEADP
ncbi:MAG: hypothetical protein H6732_11620 [Alphaproteobacteria bacterium]|nr:hypothetical protein [Alphaproteobacteria bacterium]